MRLSKLLLVLLSYCPTTCTTTTGYSHSYTLVYPQILLFLKPCCLFYFFVCMKHTLHGCTVLCPTFFIIITSVFRYLMFWIVPCFTYHCSMHVYAMFEYSKLTQFSFSVNSSVCCKCWRTDHSTLDVSLPALCSKLWFFAFYFVNSFRTDKVRQEMYWLW